MKKTVYIFIVLALITSCKSTDVSKSDELNREQNAFVSSNYIEAKKHFYKGDLENAEKKFVKCININPKHSAAMYELSKLYLLKDDIDKSIDMAEKSVEIEPENIWYIKQAAHLNKSKENYVKAAEYLSMIVAIQPNEKQNYLNLANIYIYSEDYNSALEIYDDIIKNFGFEEGVALQKKQIYLKTEQYSKAIDVINDLIEYNPQNTDYYGMAADIYKGKNDYEKAMQYYEKILELEPDNAKVHLALADYYSRTGNGEKAFEETKIAFENPGLEIDTKIKILLNLYRSDEPKAKEDSKVLLNILMLTHPNEAKANSIKADFLMKEKKLVEAKEYFEKAVKLDNSNYLLWEQLILINNELEEYEEMNRNSDKALSLFPQHSSLYYFNALSLLKLEKYKKAIEDINLGLNFTYKKEHFIDFYKLMAKVYIAQNNYEEAYYSFEKVLSYNENDVEALSAYSLYLSKNDNDIENAVKMARKALELNPESDFNEYIYALSLFKNKEYDKAKIWVEKALSTTKTKDYLSLAIDIERELGNTDKILDYELLLKKINN